VRSAVLPCAGATRTGVLPVGRPTATLDDMTTAGRTPARRDPFSTLLLESGLVTQDQLDLARARGDSFGAHVDETLVTEGVVDPDLLRRVMSRSWGIAIVDLETEWIDDELVRNGPHPLYVDDNWMPVHDQANGTVLVATARVPDPERTAEIAAALASPIEFAVATSLDIRTAVDRVLATRKRRWFFG
jgi:hypothetical protein